MLRILRVYERDPRTGLNYVWPESELNAVDEPELNAKLVR